MSRKKKNKKWLQLSHKILTILGCLIICYPFVSQIYYQYVTMQETKQFDDEKGKLVDQDVENRIELAKAYNSTLSPEKIGDPFSSRKKEEGVAEYARMLQLQEKIGYVTIPSINQKIPIRAGSSENVLQNGAGHLEGTSLPVGGVSTHTVITAHRGLPTARLFTDLDKVKVGDVFYITNIIIISFIIFFYDFENIIFIQKFFFFFSFIIHYIAIPYIHYKFFYFLTISFRKHNRVVI